MVCLACKDDYILVLKANTDANKYICVKIEDQKEAEVSKSDKCRVLDLSRANKKRILDGKDICRPKIRSFADAPHSGNPDNSEF